MSDQEGKQKPERKKPYTHWRPVDRVALVLAISLGLLGALILLATIVQIVDHQTPDLTLSENATQILIAVSGGITGLLGAYVGLNRNSRTKSKDDSDDKPKE
jgi:divalent metal cation (Fe/Co/Zn/Cd) transporter